MISVAIATYNEEENIGRCLESVVDWVDEVIVVDGNSSDKTRQIAENYGAKVKKTTNKPIFHINKQMAIDRCQNEWVLQLDADEVVSKDLAKEIKRVVKMNQKQLRERKFSRAKRRLFDQHQRIVEGRDGKAGANRGDIVAFYIPRLNYFLGGYLRHTGAYPDGVIRLFKKGQARLPCKSVHEQMEVDGQVSWLENNLIHYADYSFKRYLTRSNRYTSLTAQELLDQGRRPSFLEFVKALGLTVFTFMNLFFRHGGYKDGFPGFVFSFYSGLHHLTAYIKFYEKFNPRG